MTLSRSAALAEILAEAEILKMHRTSSATYLEKCDKLLGRINAVLIEISADDLDSEDIVKIKSIKELLLREEIYAKSSKDLRDPQRWVDSLDD